MKIVYHYILLMLATCLLTGCDLDTTDPEALLNSELQKLTTEASTTDGLILHNIQFDKNHKHFTLKGKLTKDIGSHALNDQAYYRILTDEDIIGALKGGNTDPTLTQVVKLDHSKTFKNELKVLAIVDLTLDRETVRKMREEVRSMRNICGDNDLYVTFMYDNKVTQDYLATDYVLNSYFISHPKSSKYLYRSLLTKLNELTSNAGPMGNATKKAVVMLSDQKVYRGDEPIDPDHFEVEEQLARKGKNLPDNLKIYYLNQSNKNEEDLGFGGPSLIDMLIKKKMDEGYYNWSRLERLIMKDFNITMSEYEFHFENPDQKAYRGRRHVLKIMVTDRKGNTVASGEYDYRIGSIYEPVIVNGDTLFQLDIKGLIGAAMILIILFLIIQLLIPYIQYRLFKKKYILTYTGPNMSFNNHAVEEKCYYCKSPFEVGEDIVVKCKHTVHTGCWKENGYKCPEHGLTCKEGSHYYNEDNLWDEKNAPFYKKWVLWGAVAGFIAWLFLITFGDDLHFFDDLDRATILWIYDLQEGTPEADEAIDTYGQHLFHVPQYGLCIGLFLTMVLSCLSVIKREWKYRIADIACRSLVAGIGSSIAFWLGCILSLVFRLKSNVLLIDWIPWTLSGILIAYCITWRTRIRLNIRYVLISIGIGLLSYYTWAVISMAGSDNRATLLLCYIIYAIALALSIAATAPRSDRFFLRMEGPVKQTDIALYKWLGNQNEKHVIIGKSVDCDLQMTWDIQGGIAPIQAEIYFHKGILVLHPLEETGVAFEGKTIGTAEEIQLYHGRRFQVGATTFTYIEKDNR